MELLFRKTKGMISDQHEPANQSTFEGELHPLQVRMGLCCATMRLESCVSNVNITH